MRALNSRFLAFAVPVVGLTAWLQAVDLQGAARPRMHFEPTTEEGRFVTRGAGYSLHLGPTESVLLLSPERPTRDRPRLAVAAPVAVRLRLDGANAEARAEASELLPGKSHYFRGADRSTWRRDVAHFGRVTYRQVYPGTDLTYYGTRGGARARLRRLPGRRSRTDPLPGRGRDLGACRRGGRPGPGDSGRRGEAEGPCRVPERERRQRVAVACQYVLRDERQVGFGSDRTTPGAPRHRPCSQLLDVPRRKRAGRAAWTSRSRPTARCGTSARPSRPTCPRRGQRGERRPGRVRLPLHPGRADSPEHHVHRRG